MGGPSMSRALRRLLAWLTSPPADHVPGWRPRTGHAHPAVGICANEDRTVELTEHGTCLTCGSKSVIRRGSGLELRKRVQRRRVARLLQERRARRQRERFGRSA